MAIKVEFFHDVICSFCFPMSWRMRQIASAMPDIEIVHRSFALVHEPRDFNSMFDSHHAAKEEILKHWEHANINDDGHRFNIDGMRKTDFLFPYSMPALIAAKAAYLVGGNNSYWDIFDALQEGLFVKNLNISDTAVIEKIVQSTNINFAEWQEFFNSPQSLLGVEEDLSLANSYGITSAPTLVINKKYVIVGAQKLETIMQGLNKAK
ncbi:MAG: DsbA family protein [Alphaproteobacteria bacterium]|nr:DsbA family protein [Alphaproteobacteria bacterium]